MELQKGNSTVIEAQGRRTDPININCGVLQGTPLSPALYNIATDFILDELTEPTISAKYGYQLVPHLPNLTYMGFTDDTVIIANNQENAAILTNMAKESFNEIGLQLNASKSVSINIVTWK